MKFGKGQLLAVIVAGFLGVVHATPEPAHLRK